MIDLETGAIAVGKTVGREIGGLHLARTVKIDNTLHSATGTLDQEILDTGGLGLRQHSERGTRWLAGWFDPTRQKSVDLGRGQIGPHRETPIALRARADTAADVDRNSAADRAGRIESEIIAHAIVEHALDMDIGRVIAAQLAVFETRRRAADPDVAFEHEALVVSADFQVGRFDLLAHDQPIG